MSQKKTKTRMFKLIAAAVIAAVIVAAYFIFMAVAGVNARGGDVSRDDAMEIAITHVGGGMVSSTPDLEWELWRWLWNIEVWHDGFEHELYIHPHTGEVIRHEFERG